MWDYCDGACVCAERGVVWARTLACLDDASELMQCKTNIHSVSFTHGAKQIRKQLESER